MRALLSAMPFSGHVHPLAGFAETWLARGYDLTVYTGARFADRFPGARVVTWRDAPDFDEHRVADTFSHVGRPGPLGMMNNVREIFIGTAPGQSRDLMREIDSGDYDVLIGDVMSLGAGFAAELSAIPWVTLSIVPLALSGPGLPPLGLGLTPGQGPLGSMRDAILRSLVRAGSRPLDRALAAVRSEVGLSAGPRLDQAWYSSRLTLLTGCSALDYHRSDLPGAFQYVGRIPGPRNTYPAIEVPPGKKPLVLVTQGTFDTDPAALLRPAASALASMDVQVVITTGRQGCCDLGMDLANNIQVVDFADFDALLPLCSVAVTNGGWGGTLHALSHGVSLVLAGADLDKPDIAARVTAAGLGINLKSRSPTPEAIRSAVLRALDDPAYRIAAHEVAPELPDGRLRAVDAAAGCANPPTGPE